jgi:O-antigen ligase
MRQHYGALLKLNHQGGVHNSFLTFWFDQGLVGLLIYLRSYVLVFIKSAKKTKYAFPAMFAISFTAFFESWLVGSLSAFAFMGVFIFTILTSDEIKPSEDIALVTD